MNDFFPNRLFCRRVYAKAITTLWSGDCSSETISMFTKEMLDQVVLRGQGRAGKCYSDQGVFLLKI